MQPRTQYAKSGDVHVAYQVFGEGAVDLVFVPGHISLEKFVESWNKGVDSYKADPPNATLSVLTKDGAKNVVVEIKSVEQKGSSIFFQVAVLEGMSPESFKISTLFFDAFVQTVNFLPR